MPNDPPDVVEVTGNIQLKSDAGEMISAHVTGGTLKLFNGTTNADPCKLTLTSVSDTVPSYQSFYFEQLYAELSSGTAYVKFQ